MGYCLGVGDRPPDLDNRLIRPERYGEFGTPHEAWAWLRANDPVHWTEADGLGPFWSVTTYAELMEVSARPEIFSNAAGGVVITPPAHGQPRRAQVRSAAKRLVPMDVRRRVRRHRVNPEAVRPIVMMDPPDHRVFRKVVSGFFTPRGITTLHETVGQTTRTVIDNMMATGPTVDFVEAASHRQPMMILAALLGLDEPQTNEVLTLTTAHYEITTPGPEQISPTTERTRWLTLIDAIVADRRREPRDDLSTVLAQATVDGTPLNEAELRGYFLILFTAGHDTTRHALSGGVQALVETPGEFDRLRNDANLVPTAVEEIVRWTTPVNYMKRTALQDYKLGDALIAKGDELALFYGSACRDETVFDDPDRFDVARSPNRHLGFGWAEHYCLGAHLARNSLQAFLSELRTRATAIEAAGPATYTSANFVTGLATLPLRFSWA